MTEYLKQLLLEMDKDNGNFINSLIDNEIIDLENLIKEVIKSRDVKLIYNTAKYIKKVQIHNYAKDIKDIDIKRIANAIIEGSNLSLMYPSLIYQFAKDVDGAPLGILADGIIKNGNAQYNKDAFKELFDEDYGRARKKN